MSRLNSNLIYEELHPDRVINDENNPKEYEAFFQSGLEPAFRELEYRAIYNEAPKAVHAQFYEAALAAAKRFADDSNGYLQAEGAQIAGLVSSRRIDMWPAAQEVVDRALANVHANANMARQMAKDDEKSGIEGDLCYRVAYVASSPAKWAVPPPMVAKAKATTLESLASLATIDPGSFVGIILTIGNEAPANSHAIDIATVGFYQGVQNMPHLKAMHVAVSTANETFGQPKLLPLTSAAAYVLDAGYQALAFNNNPQDRIEAVRFLECLKRDSTASKFMKLFAENRLAEGMGASRPDRGAPLQASIQSRLN